MASSRRICLLLDSLTELLSDTTDVNSLDICEKELSATGFSLQIDNGHCAGYMTEDINYVIIYRSVLVCYDDHLAVKTSHPTNSKN